MTLLDRFYKRMAMSGENCECQKDIDRVPSDIITKRHTDDRKYIDFDKVEVGTKKWLKFPIENNSKKEHYYTVIRDPDINPIYQTFTFGAFKMKLPPMSSAIFKVSYRPLFPLSWDVDYFEIIDDQGDVIRVGTVGIGQGPNVQVSSVFLRFYTWEERELCKHTIELRNDSDVPAKFHFDIDAEGHVFKVDKINGTIEPRKYVFVNISFRAKNLGVYYHQLECLILNHEPIILKLLGMHSINNDEYRDVAFIHYPEKEVSNMNYNRYMKDVQTLLTENPMFSFTENHLDFRGAPMTDNTDQNTKMSVTTFTNHTSGSITVKFEDDNIFEVFPKKVTVPAEQSALLECSFHPDKADCMYSKTHVGNIFWKDNRRSLDNVRNMEIPLSVTLKMIGHSFWDNTFWIAQLQIIPEVIVLPPTVPSSSSFTTFLLQAGGFLPVAFKFLPPKRSNFIVKPMLGLVNDYKLVVVQLKTDSHKKSKVYIEQWAIMLNDQDNHLIHFYVKGFSELPNVIVGDHNKVKFSCVQNGCTENVLVPVKNNCQHRVRYQFVIGENTSLQISNPIGEIAPNQTIYVDWSCKGLTNTSVKYTVICELRLVEKLTKVIGKPVEITVEVFTESAFSELCCIPNNCDLGVVQCHNFQTTCFDIHNFGKTAIHFILEAERGEPIELQRGNLTLSKRIGTIRPGKSTNITLHYKPADVGSHTISISYRIRTSESSEEVLPGFTKKLFTLTCLGLYPYVQIVDIAYHNFGPLFTKKALWDLLNVDRINVLLRVITRCEESDVQMSVPDNETTDELFTVILIMRNVTEFPVDLTLKRNKLCDCELKEVGDSLSLRRKKYYCPHREIFRMFADDCRVEANSVQLLRIEVKYTLQGTTIMSYFLDLSMNRRIVLHFKITALLEDFSTISYYDSRLVLNLKPVCLSEKDPSAQVYWLYNNANKFVAYKLNIGDLEDINLDNNFDVISCLNPQGEVPPYSSLALMFRFRPISNAIVEGTIPIELGNEKKHLYIVGKGNKHFDSFNFPPPRLPEFLNIDIPVILSEDHLVVEPFPVWSTCTRMIFIKNTSRNSIIGYSWLKAGVEGVVDAKVLYRKGILRPNEVHSVFIQIHSFDTPCKLLLQLPCKLLDHTKYYQHKQSLAAYNKRQAEIKNEFTITEHGIFYPDNEVVVEPFPDLFFTSVSLKVTITSTADRDLHYIPKKQIRHSPQYNICFDNLDYGAKAIPPIFDPLEKPIVTRFSILDTKRKTLSNKENTSSDYVESEDKCKQTKKSINFNEATDDINFYKTTLECIIADGIFSNLFIAALSKLRKQPPVYYEQIRSRVDEKIPREQYVNNLYNDPQPPLVSEILKEIIADSVHEVFQLGPQTKKRLNINYLRELKGFECGDRS